MKKLKQFILYCFLLLFAVAIFNFIIDPYEIYKVPTIRKSLYAFSSHIKAGLIKNRNFDSIILGSSMTQNFITNEVEEKLHYKKVLKLSESGANISEIFTILNAALNTNKVKNVFMGVDIESFANLKNELPIYLYGDSPFLSLKYILNLNTTLDSIVVLGAVILYDENNIKFKYDKIFEWQYNIQESDFSSKNALKYYEQEKTKVRNNTNIIQTQKAQKENINKLAKIAQKNPNIKFIFFYPPYSVLFYKAMKEEALSSFLYIKNYFNQQMLSLKNVKIYDFQDIFKIVANLNFYKDTTHYHQKINTWILKQIEQDEYRVKNLDLNKTKSFKEYIQEYKIKN